MKYETQMKLAANLKQLRTIRGYSQAFLAQKLQMDRSVLALYESGKRCPDPEILYRLAQIYGLPIETLLVTDPELIAVEISSRRAVEKGEQELLHLFRRLSAFSRGRLLEKAEDLLLWDMAYFSNKKSGQ